jgi:hypothetical protein
VVIFYLPRSRQRGIDASIGCARTAGASASGRGKSDFAVSSATTGRILDSLIERGGVMLAPELIRKVGRKSPAKAQHAVRKPKEVKFWEPSDVIEVAISVG